VKSQMQKSKQIAIALFVVCTAALSLLVNVISIHSKSELMVLPQYAGAYTGGYTLALEPSGQDAPEGEEVEGPTDFDQEDDDLFGPNGAIVAAADPAAASAASFAAAGAAAAPAPADPEVAYTTLHPVYSRCKAKVDLLGFSLAIQKTCGDIHELSDVAWPCRSAMQDYSKKFGCCWETVMDAYEALYPEAAQSWRLWQGTLSGKAGVTFDSQNCGESMGEKGYTDLNSQVDSLKKVIETQSSEITTLETYLGYGGNPYYYYYYKTHPSALKEGSKLAALAPSSALVPAKARKAAARRPLRAQQERRRRAVARAAPSLIDTSGSAALRRAGVKV